MTHGYELQTASLTHTHTHRRHLDCGSSRPGSRRLRIRPAQRPRTAMAPRTSGSGTTTGECAGGTAKVYARRLCAVTLADKVGYDVVSGVCCASITLNRAHLRSRSSPYDGRPSVATYTCALFFDGGVTFDDDGHRARNSSRLLPPSHPVHSQFERFGGDG
ncbi:hypothetical protein AB1N83_012626 [Pleurotus pulmonarius]